MKVSELTVKWNVTTWAKEEFYFSFSFPLFKEEERGGLFPYFSFV